MEGLRKIVVGIRAFFNDVIVEMQKCTWPERQELLQSTGVVIALLFMVSIYIAVCDKVLVGLLSLLIPSG